MDETPTNALDRGDYNQFDAVVLEPCWGGIRYLKDMQGTHEMYLERGEFKPRYFDGLTGKKDKDDVERRVSLVDHIQNILTANPRVRVVSCLIPWNANHLEMVQRLTMNGFHVFMWDPNIHNYGLFVPDLKTGDIGGNFARDVEEKLRNNYKKYKGPDTYLFVRRMKDVQASSIMWAEWFSKSPENRGPVLITNTALVQPEEPSSNTFLKQHASLPGGAVVVMLNGREDEIGEAIDDLYRNNDSKAQGNDDNADEDSGDDEYYIDEENEEFDRYDEEKDIYVYHDRQNREFHYVRPNVRRYKIGRDQYKDVDVTGYRGATFGSGGGNSGKGGVGVGGGGGGGTPMNADDWDNLGSKKKENPDKEKKPPVAGGKNTSRQNDVSVPKKSTERGEPSTVKDLADAMEKSKKHVVDCAEREEDGEAARGNPERIKKDQAKTMRLENELNRIFDECMEAIAPAVLLSACDDILRGLILERVKFKLEHGNHGAAAGLTPGREFDAALFQFNNVNNAYGACEEKALRFRNDAFNRVPINDLGGLIMKYQNDMIKVYMEGGQNRIVKDALIASKRDMLQRTIERFESNPRNESKWKIIERLEAKKKGAQGKKITGEFPQVMREVMNNIQTIRNQTRQSRRQNVLDAMSDKDKIRYIVDELRDGLEKKYEPEFIMQFRVEIAMIVWDMEMKYKKEHGGAIREVPESLFFMGKNKTKPDKALMGLIHKGREMYEVAKEVNNVKTLIENMVADATLAEAHAVAVEEDRKQKKRERETTNIRERNDERDKVRRDFKSFIEKELESAQLILRERERVVYEQRADDLAEVGAMFARARFMDPTQAETENGEPQKEGEDEEEFSHGEWELYRDEDSGNVFIKSKTSDIWLTVPENINLLRPDRMLTYTTLIDVEIDTTNGGKIKFPKNTDTVGFKVTETNGSKKVIACPIVMEITNIDWTTLSFAEMRNLLDEGPQRKVAPVWEQSGGIIPIYLLMHKRFMELKMKYLK